ncbi:MAG: DUF3084 domain-containing protein [Armatimonadota bacterium]|nr:DUF3084 domain-containing protein [Armatimonadota bacterium]MDR5697526.1 DUF3084 domain-containing protein [Armatimonadota bacterium]
MDIGFILVPILLVVSGLIAFVGNLVGRRAGKQRLSLFGLRPRTTAQIVTVLAGILINVVTVGAVLAFSRDARIALFELRETLDALERRADALRREIRALEQGDIAVLRGQEVARGIVDGRAPLSTIRNVFFRVRQEAVEFASSQGAGPDGAGNVILPDPPGQTWEAWERIIGQRNREVVVRLVSTKNVLAGTPVPVEVILVNNELVYPRGRTIAEGTVRRGSREDIQHALLELAATAVRAAEGKILSAPRQRVGGPPFFVLDLDSGRRVTDQIAAGPARQHRVRVIALADTYTNGPLILGFEAP